MQHDKLFEKRNEAQVESVSEMTEEPDAVCRTNGRRTLFLTLLVLAVFGLLFAVGWYAVRYQLPQLPEYQFSAERIKLEPEPPVHIPDDFIEHILKMSGLDGPGVTLDSNTPNKLHQAFAAYPWVEEVKKVEMRYPQGAKINLVYRVPVAMVEIPSQKLYPVDKFGVLLPTEYFLDGDSEKVNELLRIKGVKTMPFGTVGTLWGDHSVHIAANVADAVRDVSRSLRLAAVVPSTEMTSTGDRILCKILTSNGTEIIWGRYDPQSPQESQAERKKNRLIELARMYQTLDRVPHQFQPIDLTKE